MVEGTTGCSEDVLQKILQELGVLKQLVVYLVSQQIGPASGPAQGGSHGAAGAAASTPNTGQFLASPETLQAIQDLVNAQLSAALLATVQPASCQAAPGGRSIVLPGPSQSAPPSTAPSPRGQGPAAPAAESTRPRAGRPPILQTPSSPASPTGSIALLSPVSPRTGIVLPLPEPALLSHSPLSTHASLESIHGRGRQPSSAYNVQPASPSGPPQSHLHPVQRQANIQGEKTIWQSKSILSSYRQMLNAENPYAQPRFIDVVQQARRLRLANQEVSPSWQSGSQQPGDADKPAAGSRQPTPAPAPQQMSKAKRRFIAAVRAVIQLQRQHRQQQQAAAQPAARTAALQSEHERAIEWLQNTSSLRKMSSVASPLATPSTDVPPSTSTTFELDMQTTTRNTLELGFRLPPDSLAQEDFRLQAHGGAMLVESSGPSNAWMMASRQRRKSLVLASSPEPPPAVLMEATKENPVDSVRPRYNLEGGEAPGSAKKLALHDVAPVEVQQIAPVAWEDDCPMMIQNLRARWPCTAFVLRVLWALTWEILVPGGRFRNYWEFIMLFMLFYVCITIPYHIAFDVNTGDLHAGIGVFEMMVTATFMLDIVFNFRTTFMGENGKFTRDRRQIAAAYIKGWFILDLVSTLPLEQFTHSDSMNAVQLFKATRFMRVARVLRVVKIVKLLRLLKLPALMRSLEQKIGRALMRMASFVVAALMMIHWSACAFHYVSQITSEHSSWTQKMHVETKSKGVKYIYSLYWAVTTMCTVGYGDIVATNVSEMFVSMLAMIMGTTVFAYFMGAMSTLLTALNTVNARMTTRRQAVEDFLSNRKIPPQLAERVRSFYSYVLVREVHADETDLIAGLSSTLRHEVVMYLYQDAVEKVPFFKNKHPQFIAAIVTQLKLEYYSPGDVVVTQGETGSEMYFIGEGDLEVRVYNEGCVPGYQKSTYKSPKSKPWPTWSKTARLKPEDIAAETAAQSASSYRKLGMLRAGMFFGEYACLLGATRASTVVATGYCELYSLTRADLDSAIEKFPELGDEFEQMIEGYHREQQELQTSGGYSRTPSFRAGPPAGAASRLFAAQSSEIATGSLVKGLLEEVAAKIEGTPAQAEGSSTHESSMQSGTEQDHALASTSERTLRRSELSASSQPDAEAQQQSKDRVAIKERLDRARQRYAMK